MSFVYDGLPRVVEPYCHGETSTGLEALRAIQVAGQSRSGPTTPLTGKLWSAEKMQSAQLLDETFTPSDPLYNPNDTAMRIIHCRI